MGKAEAIWMESGLPDGPQTSRPSANAIIDAKPTEPFSQPGTKHNT